MLKIRICLVKRKIKKLQREKAEKAMKKKENFKKLLRSPTDEHLKSFYEKSGFTQIEPSIEICNLAAQNIDM